MVYDSSVVQAGYNKELYENSHEFYRALNRVSKIIIDYPIALAASAATLPIIGATAILIKLESYGPVFYIPTRIGEDCKPIKVRKLRSMVHGGREMLNGKMLDGYESSGAYLRDKETFITRIGKVLRKYSLDEMPQFWDVLLGRMSLVGPRALHPLEVKNLPPEALERFSCPAGITGNWQISNRSGPEERTMLDINYARRYNNEWIIPYDLEIVFKTVLYVLFGKNH
ncbi:MAG: sugar transferase [Candidatus Aenigmarchaeota archaeon]|nr:sugar transferase [Candidatus Aenigmarchaeota archaeon]